MKLVPQDHVNVAEECEEYRNGLRKNFGRSRHYFTSYSPAWVTKDDYFQATIHREPIQGSDVLAFASGRLTKVHGLDVAVIELFGVGEELRGKRFGIRLHEWVHKMTGLPLAAAHIQTPQGVELWKRMLIHTKRKTISVLTPTQRFKIETPEDWDALGFDPLDGSDATFILEKIMNGFHVRRKVLSEVEA